MSLFLFFIFYFLIYILIFLFFIILSNGQLGVDGTYNNFPVYVNLNKTVNTITTMYKHTCAITTENRVYCWGNNG